ncbi:MAG: hypothetical protein WCT20_00375 [Candidatus Babeliales bacterium]|jgi:hypothetical protein
MSERATNPKVLGMSMLAGTLCSIIENYYDEKEKAKLKQEINLIDAKIATLKQAAVAQE